MLKGHRELFGSGGSGEVVSHGLGERGCGKRTGWFFFNLTVAYEVSKFPCKPGKVWW